MAAKACHRFCTTTCTHGAHTFLYRPDTTFEVDWALKTNSLSICLACAYTLKTNSLSVCLACAYTFTHTHTRTMRQTTQTPIAQSKKCCVDRHVPEVADTAVLVVQRQQGFPGQLAVQHEPRPTTQQVGGACNEHEQLATVMDKLESPDWNGNILLWV